MPEPQSDSRQGFFYALTAYVLWGLLPVYMKAVAHISAVEVVAHRVIWSIPIAGAVLLFSRRTADLRVALTDMRTIGMGLITAGLIAFNWGIYVWSIANDRTLDAALGYYINPLFSVFLAFVLLRERLSALQWLAIAVALSAVVILTIDAGQLPLPAVGMFVSFGLYGYFKKSLPIGPNQGFMLEVLLLLPIAAALLFYFGATGSGLFLTNAQDTWLLLASGLITAVPLMLYGNGAKRLRLTTIAMMQYIAPTMIFLFAVFVFDEPFGTAQQIAFPLIWLSLVIYSISLWRKA